MPWAHDTVAYSYDPLDRPLSRQIKNDSNVVLQSDAWTYDALGRVTSTVNGLGTHTVTYDGNSSCPLSAVTKRPNQGLAFLTRQFVWQTGTQGAADAVEPVGSDAGEAHGGAFDLVSAVAGGIVAPGPPFDHAAGAIGLVEGGQLAVGIVGEIPLGDSTSELAAPGGDLAGGGVGVGEVRHHDRGAGALAIFQLGEPGARRTLVEGTVSEPSTVTVNGEPAGLRPLPGGESFLYSKDLDLGTGEKRLEIEATDSNGNVARRSYTVTVGGVERTLSHDLNGNVTLEDLPGYHQDRTYEWDALNRLTATQQGTKRTEFTYDGQSRRVRIVEKTGSTVQSDHRYLWCGTEICPKRDSTGGTVVAKYYDQGEQRISGSNTTDYYFTRDHLGSVRDVIQATTSNTGYEVRLRYDYTPWGERIKIGGTAQNQSESDGF